MSATIYIYSSVSLGLHTLEEYYLRELKVDILLTKDLNCSSCSSIQRTSTWSSTLLSSVLFNLTPPGSNLSRMFSHADLSSTRSSPCSRVEILEVTFILKYQYRLTKPASCLVSKFSKLFYSISALFDKMYFLTFFYVYLYIYICLIHFYKRFCRSSRTISP